MLHALLMPAALALDVGATILGVHAKLQNALAPQICSDETFDLGGGATGRFLWANSHDIFVIGGRRLGGVYEWWEWWYRVVLG